MTALAWALRNWQGLAAGVALAFLTYQGTWLIAHRVGVSDGKAQERQAAIIAAGKRIVEMEKNNEAFRTLPARDRCLAFMRDSGLPDHHCDER